MFKSKKSLFVIIVMMITIFSIYSQEANTQNVSSDTQSVQNGTFESNSSYFNTAATEAQNSNGEYKAPSTAGFLIKTIVALLLVVAAIYGIMLFFKKKNNVAKSDDDFLRRVSSLTFAPGKSVEIVTLLDHAYILGVTDSNINLLGQVEDKELIEAMNLNFDKKQNVKKPMNFSDVLDIFMPRGPRNNTNIYQSAEDKVNNLDSSENQNE